jgi:hypothetical protein
MNKLQKTFYIGSCRYQPLFANIFPPRLHSTREIINFLKNYKTIDITQAGVNKIWGDIAHPDVIAQSTGFLNNVESTFNNIEGIVIEVCTRKVYMHNMTPLNAFFVEFYEDKCTEYQLINLTDDELISDLMFIKNYILEEYGIQKLAVIPHVNFPLRDSNNLIPERVSLSKALEVACTSYNINYIDPARVNFLKTNTTPYLEDILRDSTHYSNCVILQLILEYLRELGWE